MLGNITMKWHLHYTIMQAANASSILQIAIYVEHLPKNTGIIL